jgi:hypothetical protein
MTVKKTFELLKGVPNILHLSREEIDKVSVPKAQRIAFVSLELNQDRINHYTKDKVMSLVSNIKLRESKLHIVTLPDYILPVSYNTTTDGIVINISPLGLNTITTDKPSVFDLYALLVYGITFRDIASGNIKINERFYQPISNYFYSILMRMFGKMYGLSGTFTYKINELKFMTSMYVLQSFFEQGDSKSKNKASSASSFNYNEIENFESYNFKTIDGYINALSKSGVMPNINRHLFTATVLNKLTFSFLPGFEDLARLISILTTADLKSTSIVPTYISKYNEREFHNIIEISKIIFKKKF